jgi:FkbM family methyltransferase
MPSNKALRGRTAPDDVGGEAPVTRDARATKPSILNTRRLFLRLLRTFEIDTVCDVGSMDGTDALRFRRVLPAAEIIAFEPNPRNFALMETDARLARRRIRVLPIAASDHDGEAPFFVVAARYVRNRDVPRRGMSSLHARFDSSALAETVRVPTVRLDRALAADGGRRRRVALWIDTEGMAYEAIAGAVNVLDRTQMLHVEVETLPCIGAEQRVFADVEELLLEAGFALLAMDKPQTEIQFNALFVRADCLRTKATLIRWHSANGRLRRGVWQSVRPLLPPRLRRFVKHRLDGIRG